MIYDTLEHLGQYESLSPNLAKGLRFLTRPDLKDLPEGRVEIDGDQVFAMIQEYTTKVEADILPEAHRAYADIQYLLEGEELMGVAPVEWMEAEVEAHPDRDIWFYRGTTEKVPMGKGRFVVVFPGDAHAPSMAPGQPAFARKCVVKVKV